MSVEAVKILLGEVVGVGPIGVCPAKGLVTVFGEVQGTEFNGVVEEGVVGGGAVVAEGVVEVEEDGLDVSIDWAGGGEIVWEGHSGWGMSIPRNKGRLFAKVALLLYNFGILKRLGDERSMIKAQSFFSRFMEARVCYSRINFMVLVFTL